MHNLIYHQPLYRVAKIFGCLGVNIPERKLGNIYSESSRIIKSIYDADKNEVKGGGYVNMNEQQIPHRHD